jgi:pimeloyl-ACP methyl ester carboxylesterase
MADVAANGVRLNVVALGERAPTLVFVHGLLLDNHSSFYMSIAPGIAKHARVVLYDLRGHGRSDQPRAGYRVDDMVEDLAGLVAAVAAGERVVVVGHSFGGTIALRYALRHPARVAGLVLLEAHAGLAELGERMAQTMLLTGDARDAKIVELFGDWLARHGARGQVDARGDVSIDEAALTADGQATLKFAGRIQRRRKSALVATAERLRDETTFVADIRATTPLADAELARVACPVLAFYGERSDVRAQGEALARALPACRLEIVPGAEHGVLFQATAFVRDTTVAWLAGGMR